MFQNIIHKILVRRHFWRYATFSEVSELYASRMLRMLALNIAASFMSIFLYQNGFSIPFIAFFWALFFSFKAIMALPLAAITARIGSKHGILLSNIMYIPSMIIFALIPTYGPLLLILVVLLQGSSAALYSISYSTDFSKVKSSDHAGKEIAYMNIIEKVTAGLSPLIGGLLAFAFGPEVVLVIAAVLFSLAAAPLLRTAEQEKPNQKLVFKGFAWHLIRPNIPTHLAVGFDVFSSGTVWSIFVAVFVIGVASTNEVYAANGALMSVVVFAALAASYAYGKLIDKKRGGDLLRVAAIGNSLTHLMRAFTATPIAVAGLNIANEAATTGYSMALTRGIFDNADLSGQRVTYIGVVEAIANLGAAIAGFVLFFLATLLEHQLSIHVFFFIAAAVVLLIGLARFPLYQK